jgi:ADP-ribose pyrophosphatase YjhB (NUDIX family)
MENGETLEQAAARETQEEACARVRDLTLYTLFDLPHINQVYMLFKGELNDLNFSAGSESLEVKLFTEAEIPWKQLAFPSIRKTLEYYFSDRSQQRYPLRSEVLAGKPPLPINE